MKISDPLREALLENKSGSVIKEIAIREGMITMRVAGVRRVLEGDTTIDEVFRVLMTEEAGDEPDQLKKAA
jgi:type II secretory ATPase GspE/PulE/Tfp pilus assembly ATPase PilB-like protein